MFEPRVPLPEIILRVLLIYLFLLLAMRLVGRKEMRLLEQLIEGSPELLIEDGRVSEKATRREMVTEQQLLAALRREQIESAAEVSRAYIESDGRITVIPRKKAASGE